MKFRVLDHPIIEIEDRNQVVLNVDGKPYKAFEGETIASALAANGILNHRKTHKTGESRGVFCGIGQCNDCCMVVDDVPNVRTCITPVSDGMCVETQIGYGNWSKSAKRN